MSRTVPAGTNIAIDFPTVYNAGRALSPVTVVSIGWCTCDGASYGASGSASFANATAGVAPVDTNGGYKIAATTPGEAGDYQIYAKVTDNSSSPLTVYLRSETLTVTATAAPDANIVAVNGDLNGVTTNNSATGAVRAITGALDDQDAAIGGFLLAAALELMGIELRATPSSGSPVTLSIGSGPAAWPFAFQSADQQNELVYDPEALQWEYVDALGNLFVNVSATPSILGVYTAVSPATGTVTISLARNVAAADPSGWPAGTAALAAANLPAAVAVAVANAVIAAAVSGGLVQYVPGGSSGSSSGSIAEPPMQFTPQALAQIPPPVSISTQDMTAWKRNAGPACQ